MKLKTGKGLTNAEWGAISTASQTFATLNMHTVENPNLSVNELRETLQTLTKKHGKLGAVMIDYLQLMDGDGSENRTQEISRISRAMKKVAMEFDTTIFLLSQLSRGVESRTNKRPMMSDLRESGQIEQDADLILMLYRDEYYDKNSEERGIAEVNAVKHREGETGTVKLLFEPEYSRFRNIAR